MKVVALHLRLAVCMFSLLLAAALAPMWYRSHQRPDYIDYTSPDGWLVALISGHGTVDVLYIADWPGTPGFYTTRYDRHVYYGTRYSRRFLGFGSAAQHNGGRFVNIPYWFLVACCGAAAALSFRSWRRQRMRLLVGRCHICGYDLRATPE